MLDPLLTLCCPQMVSSKAKSQRISFPSLRSSQRHWKLHLYASWETTEKLQPDLQSSFVELFLHLHMSLSINSFSDSLFFEKWSLSFKAIWLHANDSRDHLILPDKLSTLFWNILEYTILGYRLCNIRFHELGECATRFLNSHYNNHQPETAERN